MRALALALLTCAFTVAAENPYVGTWRMDKAKSTPDPDLPALDSLTVEFVQEGRTLKAIPIVNGAASATVLIDGREHTMGGKRPDPLGATHYVSTATGKTNLTVFKRDGRTVATRKNSISRDGKTMTSQTTGTLSNGKKLNVSILLDRQ